MSLTALIYIDFPLNIWQQFGKQEWFIKFLLTNLPLYYIAHIRMAQTLRCGLQRNCKRVSLQAQGQMLPIVYLLKLLLIGLLVSSRDSKALSISPFNLMSSYISTSQNIESTVLIKPVSSPMNKHTLLQR
jgi:hypothetical protein